MGVGGPGSYCPSAPSPLTQIVPNSASPYTVFHSVIFNSVSLLYRMFGLNNSSTLFHVPYTYYVCDYSICEYLQYSWNGCLFGSVNGVVLLYS